MKKQYPPWLLAANEITRVPLEFMWGIFRLPDVIEHARHATSNQPILVIPPFPAPNAWTFLLRSALERCGFKTDIWDLPVKFRFIRLNSGFDFERDIPKAIAKLKGMYEASGNQKITIVGHSLGAAEALVFAAHPETRNYIAGIVMFGGPLTFDPKTVNPIIRGLYEWINGSLTQHSTNVTGLLEENGLRIPAISWRSKGDGFIKSTSSVCHYGDQTQNLATNKWHSHCGMPFMPECILLAAHMAAQAGESVYKSFDMMDYPGFFGQPGATRQIASRFLGRKAKVENAEEPAFR